MPRHWIVSCEYEINGETLEEAFVAALALLPKDVRMVKVEDCLIEDDDA